MRLPIRKEYQKLNYTPERQPVNDPDIVFLMVMTIALAILLGFAMYFAYGGKK